MFNQLLEAIELEIGYAQWLSWTASRDRSRAHYRYLDGRDS